MNKVIEIEDIGSHPTVQRLIEAVVEQQVREYNSKPLEKNLLPFLDQETVDTAAKSGDDDPRSAELLAKVLLLARDKEIKDPLILQQLR